MSDTGFIPYGRQDISDEDIAAVLTEAGIGTNG